MCCFCSLPRTLHHYHTVWVWWHQLEQTASTRFSRKGSMHPRATFHSTGTFVVTALCSWDDCVSQHNLFPIWKSQQRKQCCWCFASPLFLSVKPRVTFQSWRLLCPRGCERSSTGCRTTERSAPRYTWSSKHCCTSGLTSDPLDPRSAHLPVCYWVLVWDIRWVSVQRKC